MKKVLILVLAAAMVLMLFAACADDGAVTSETTPQESVEATDSGESSADSGEQAGTSCDPDEMLAELDGKSITVGPNGETPVFASEISITDEQIEQVKAMNLKAAIAMQYTGNDWSQAQIDALKATFEKYGIEVIAVTDPNFDAAQQTADIESILAMDPDILVSIPVDTAANSAIYKKATEQGVKVVFMNQAGDNLVPGEDYVTIVSPDDMGNGARCAHLLAKAIGGKGKIGIIYYDAVFRTTEIRYDEALKVFAECYPEIEIVEEQGFSGSDSSGAAGEVAAAMLTKHPDLDGIWAIWDVPAEGIIAAVKQAGMEDQVAVATIDLGLNVGIELAKGGVIKGLAAQQVYDAGVCEATCAALACLGEEVPTFITTSGFVVEQDNVLDMWKNVYYTDPPQELLDAAKAQQ